MKLIKIVILSIALIFFVGCGLIDQLSGGYKGSKPHNCTVTPKE